MDIRKISIGPDYKSSAMHYIVGQEILGSKYKIHLIKQVQELEKMDKKSEFLRKWNETTIKDRKKEIQVVDKILKNMIRF